MPSVHETVAEARELIRKRLHDLDAERAQLQRALSNLTGGREGRRGPGRPRRAASGKTASGKTTSGKTTRRRRKGTTRADQAVKIVAENPGITASEVAKRMKIKPNYIYRVLGELEKQGKVRKDGRAYHAA